MIITALPTLTPFSSLSLSLSLIYYPCMEIPLNGTTERKVTFFFISLIKKMMKVAITVVKTRVKVNARTERV
jgi:hypothetical protein